MGLWEWQPSSKSTGGNLTTWLDPKVQDEQELSRLLNPYPTELMIARPASRLVNNPKYNSAELIA